MIMYEFNFSINLFVVIWGILLSAISVYGLIYAPWILKNDKKAQSWINVSFAMVLFMGTAQFFMISDFDFMILLATVCISSCFFVSVALLWWIGKKIKKQSNDFESIVSKKDNSEYRKRVWSTAENYSLALFLWLFYAVGAAPLIVCHDYYNKVVSYSRDGKEVLTARFGVDLQFDEGNVFFEEKGAKVYKKLTPEETKEARGILIKKDKQLRSFRVSEKTDFADIPSEFCDFIKKVSRRDGNFEIRAD